MNFAFFINALHSAKRSEMSFLLRDIDYFESQPNEEKTHKHLTGSFIAGFKCGNAELILVQGVSIDYTSHHDDRGAYSREPLVRVDYLDNILINGFEDVQGGRFDLAFLLSQLENQNIQNATVMNNRIESLVDAMQKQAGIDLPENTQLLHGKFDEYIVAMPDVKLIKLEAGLDVRLLEQIAEIKMSQVSAHIQSVAYTIDSLRFEEATNLHKYVSGWITAQFGLPDLAVTMRYYMQRKYPKHADAKTAIKINNTNFPKQRIITVEGKMGSLTLDLADQEASIKTIKELGGSSSIFFKLQSLFGLVIRDNHNRVISETFDAFYDNFHSMDGSKPSRLAPNMNRMSWKYQK